MLSETSKTIVGIIIDQLEKGDIKGQKEYGVSIDDAEDVKYQWNLEAMQEMADALKYQQKEIEKIRKLFDEVSNINLEFRKEIEFLKQRNKELRQKTWYSVYEENLKLQEMMKVRENQLSQSAEISDNFYSQMIEAQTENRHLKEVLKSVETFINQFA